MDKSFKQVKKIVIVTLIIVTVMIVGGIVLAQNNELFKAKPSDRWQVEFSSIVEGKIVGNAKSRKRPQHTATQASFYVDLVVPGDSITYDLQVVNKGTLDSKLQDIIWVTSPNKEAIKYEIIGLKEGDKLTAGKTRNFKIKVSYELTSQEAVTFNKPVSITLNFVQDM